MLAGSHILCLKMIKALKILVFGIVFFLWGWVLYNHLPLSKLRELKNEFPDKEMMWKENYNFETVLKDTAEDIDDIKQVIIDKTRLQGIEETEDQITFIFK